jgi:hypothetical protein
MWIEGSRVELGGKLGLEGGENSQAIPMGAPKEVSGIYDRSPATGGTDRRGGLFDAILL